MDGEGDERIASNVIRAVAAYANKQPSELPLLYEAIDPDALEGIFAPTGEGAREIGKVVFPYAGYRVTVAADGTVDVEPLVDARMD